jgi:hypothetical protein
LSTFEAARAKFGVGGRQKSNISPSFCLLSDPRTLNLDQPVDKNEAFTPVFVLLLVPRAKAGFRAKPQSTKLLKGRLRFREKCHFLRFAHKCRERRLNHKESVDSRGIKSSFAAVSSAFYKKIGCMKYADGGSLRF